MIVEQSLKFESTPEALWPWIADPARRAQWIQDAQRVEVRVERSDPPRTLVLSAGGLPNDMQVRLEIALVPEGNGTRVDLRAQTELTGMMIFAEKMIASKAKSKLASWAENLRALVAAG
ncbi:MAG: hypothetical protein IPJ19_16260 [Planctomycetes bacterium]|nr:hypothetical protein [Planctomycetota bacterium]